MLCILSPPWEESFFITSLSGGEKQGEDRIARLSSARGGSGFVPKSLINQFPCLIQITKLQGIKMTVEAIMFNEFSVGSGFNDASIFKDQDTIGVLYGREAMGDYKGGPILHQSIKCVLDLGL